MLKILGIETSCDETAASVVCEDGSILSNVVVSQLEDHRPYGGVVPEIAARSHLAHFSPLVTEAMTRAGLGFADLDGVAATTGPGLIGGVMVGATGAKAIALGAGKPFLAINHLEAHALTARLAFVSEDPITFPYLLLLVSGGHCQLLAVEAVGRYTLYGTTLDDAIGEAFDKTAKMLGLGYPGGPALEAAAAQAQNTGHETDTVSGQPPRFTLPRPMLGRPDLNFSFAGLKTAVRKTLEAEGFPPGDAVLPPQDIVAALCAEFQEAVADILIDRCGRALDRFIEAYPDVAPCLVVAGGVAANSVLRGALLARCEARNVRFAAPPIALCTDNGAMVAWAGIEKLRLGQEDGLDIAPRPRWPLDDKAIVKKGSRAHGV